MTATETVINEIKEDTFEKSYILERVKTSQTSSGKRLNAILLLALLSNFKLYLATFIWFKDGGFHKTKFFLVWTLFKITQTIRFSINYINDQNFRELQRSRFLISKNFCVRYSTGWLHHKSVMNCVAVGSRQLSIVCIDLRWFLSMKATELRIHLNVEKLSITANAFLRMLFRADAH